MKVWFDGDVAQESYQFGASILLTPGENDLDEAVAKAALKAGVVTKEKPSAKKK